MLDFFGLNRVLSRENLWCNEKERLKVIKRVEMAGDCSLSMHVLDIIFPLGWKSTETICGKCNFKRKIEDKHPLPQIESRLLQEMSEQEMRIHMEKLANTLEKQFDMCIELLYNISQTDEKFVELKQIFVKKFLKVSKLEIIIGCFSVVWSIIFVLGLFALIIKDASLKIIEYLIFHFIAVVVLPLFMSPYFMSRYFKIGENDYPRL